MKLTKSVMQVWLILAMSMFGVFMFSTAPFIFLSFGVILFIVYFGSGLILMILAGYISIIVAKKVEHINGE